MKSIPSFRAGVLGLLPALALLGAVTGCVVEERRPAPVYVAPPVVQVAPVMVEEDDYVYYPRYQMYYGSRSHRYFYQEGRSWVAHPEPRGVPVQVLVGSPSVRVGFHDAPSAHHAQIRQAYPRRWKPPENDQGHGHH